MAIILDQRGAALLDQDGAEILDQAGAPVVAGAASLSASPSLSCSYLSARITISATTMFPGKDQGIYGPSGDSSTVVVPGVIDGVFDT
jgi:hypothetical protein